MADPISLDHLERKLVELNEEMRSGALDHGEYDQRLARMISELRDRKVDADRETINTKLGELAGKGVITPSVRDHIESRLGLS
jgi:hypothetical protein